MPMRTRWVGFVALAFVGTMTSVAAEETDVRTGHAAYGDWRTDAPGGRRKITPADLPAPLASEAVSNPSFLFPRLSGAIPEAPADFSVSLFAQGLDQPRGIRIAPNGDIFIAESEAGQVRVLRSKDGAVTAKTSKIFASGLTWSFGIALYPPGANPRYLYVAATDRVVRYRYRVGDMTADGPEEVVVGSLPNDGGHWTRDIAFSPDGRTMYVSVGSASNVAQGLDIIRGPELAAFAQSHPVGVSWGPERDRADVLAFDPEGHGKHVYATGIRNCSGLAVQPATGLLWCATNERDLLGDDLPPDYVTRVKQGGFYGWPWYYIGDHEDPRHVGERPDLSGKVVTPDILLQTHSAPLSIAFYEGAQFPEDYKGEAFVALHGSWNRAKRTGYKVVRLRFKNDEPTGDYEDFLTGFVTNDSGVWGRPVGVAVAKDGALLVTDDGGGAVWRVAYKATRTAERSP